MSPSFTDLVEEAFLSCLEDGADPPECMDIRLPIEWFGKTKPGTVLQVAGYSVTLIAVVEEL